MLFPKKIKYRKRQTGRENPNKTTVASRGTLISFGSHALKAQTEARLTGNQLEAARRVMSRTTGKTGKIWIRVFPDLPFTKKPPEVGMGKGKGDPCGFYTSVKPGRIIFEIDGVSDAKAVEAFRKASAKLPLKTKVVKR